LAEKKKKRPIEIEDFFKIVYFEDPRVSPDGQWIAHVQVTIDRLENTYRRNIWLAPTDGGKPVQVTRGGKDSQPRWSPDGSMLAFVSARSEKLQVYVMRVGTPGGDPRALTSLENGASNPAWSPDGNFIAFTAGLNAGERAKEGEEEETPKDKLEAKHRKERREEDEKKRFDPRWVRRVPFREGTSFRDERFEQVYVIAVDENLLKEESKPRRLTDLNEDYGQPEWTPDGKYLITNRAEDQQKDEPFWIQNLYKISVEDGQEEVLTPDSYSDVQPRLSPDGKWIAYFRGPRKSLAPTIATLAVIPSEGGEPCDLTLELDREPNDFRWSADSQWIYLTVNNEGRIEIYRVSPEGGEVERVISAIMDIEGFDVAADGGITFVAETPLSPPELFWQPPGADEPLQLTEANKELLDEVTVQPTQEMWVTSPDGQKVQAWYILPVGYQEGKKYPLAFEIHGGPAAMWTPSTRSMWHEWQLHAARGYVVLYSNPRGSDGYGQTFRGAIQGRFAEPAYTDLMAVVDALVERGFVDEQRMAVTGGSYGGYMTAWIVGHTDRFACALAARGVYNLISMFGTSDIPSFTQEYLGVELWEDHNRLWEWSPLAYAQNIKTPLLIKAAENDFRVPIEQSEQLHLIARRAGAPVEFIRYARDGHELSRSGEPEHRLSRYNIMMEWFDKYCKPS